MSTPLRSIAPFRVVVQRTCTRFRIVMRRIWLSKIPLFQKCGNLCEANLPLVGSIELGGNFGIEAPSTTSWWSRHVAALVTFMVVRFESVFRSPAMRFRPPPKLRYALKCQFLFPFRRTLIRCLFASVGSVSARSENIFTRPV